MIYIENGFKRILKWFGKYRLLDCRLLDCKEEEIYLTQRAGREDINDMKDVNCLNRICGIK
ncbi:MAG: hypothetical protein A2X61_10980 [Ignavibacteria bacterium GWB2_35_12]|nr:MAG: hypothetical protein A2X63_05195 [Ignavibacteria bacterium GWA2_35_8]OGU40334.1 MAG: hypothetical protein A2X61_10980 [Ignavibacteria bacterium GWB2_35_12]OGU93070.1 MAG: hypothetical protein A2220_16100 [Ignavibacteria bacterium RIFOXYA2_FULL_35_10]OGV24762.1 MAG: hypothetical protein A2475_14205 [Ignavibacteria bacterium RIFOXYC2_FULL_35_21]